MAANGGKHEKRSGVVEMNSSPNQNRIVQNYLTEFRKKLRFINAKDKQNILNEIESHLYEKAESLGGLTDDNFARATKEFGSPKDISNHYKELYSYSTGFIVLLVIIGFIVSLLSVPFSVPGLNKDLIALNNLCLGLSTIFTILIFAFIIYVGLNFGKWAGLYVGISCLVARIIMVAILVGIMGAQSGDITVTADGGPCFLFGIITIMMPLVGFLAGRTTFKFKEGFALDDELKFM